jgi:hypothetical protein
MKTIIFIITLTVCAGCNEDIDFELNSDMDPDSEVDTEYSNENATDDNTCTRNDMEYPSGSQLCSIPINDSYRMYSVCANGEWEIFNCLGKYDVCQDSEDLIITCLGPAHN